MKKPAGDADKRRVRLSKAQGQDSFLDQFTSTYLRARWFLGFGMIALTILLASADILGSDAWVIAAAGAVIILHAYAMQAWEMREVTVALLVDVTAALIVGLMVSWGGETLIPAVLTFVGASVLVALFTEFRARIGITFYLSAATFATLLIVEEWDVTAALGPFIGAAFVVALTMGVVAAFRSRIVELDATRAQTIGVVSHELRNHLTGIIGAIELVADESSRLREDEAEELLGLAYQQSIEAEEVIEDLLIASRAERGVLGVVPEVVDLGPITGTVIHRTALESDRIVYDQPNEPVWAVADSLRYKQIVRNLLTNAYRYGGDSIRVSVQRYDDTVSVVVADDGPGVEAGDESVLFQPYRSGKAVKAVTESTGLGLWISRSLARKMGGDLTYRRLDGQTVFELVLPSGPESLDPESSDVATLSTAMS